MSRFIEVNGPIEGVNLDKVKLAVQILRESGLPPRTLSAILSDLQTEQCSKCKRHWPMQAQGVRPAPSWRYARSRLTRHSSSDERIPFPVGWYPDVLILKKYKDNNHTVETNACWDSGGEWTHLSRACETCLIEHAPRFGKEVAALPKKQLAVFLRLYKWSLPHLLKRYHADYALKFYIAFTNGIMQHLPAEEKKLWLTVVDCAHTLKLL